MMWSSTRTLAVLGCVVAVAACSRDKDRQTTLEQEGKTTVTGANVSLTSQAAVGSIVDARCTREAACNNIGVDKPYGNREACISKLKADMKEDLNANECPKGIDRKELDECLSEIRTEGCGNPIDKIERLAACRMSDLCLKAR